MLFSTASFITRQQKLCFQLWDICIHLHIYILVKGRITRNGGDRKYKLFWQAMMMRYGNWDQC